MKISVLPILIAGLAALTPARGQAPTELPTLPQVTGAWINAGNPQRSMIQSVGVRFDRNAFGSVRK